MPVVPDDQLSLAIGREGQNARLAAKLTGWRIDILSESKYAQVRAEEEVAARVARSLAEEAPLRRQLKKQQKSPHRTLNKH